MTGNRFLAVKYIVFVIATLTMCSLPLLVQSAPGEHGGHGNHEEHHGHGKHDDHHDEPAKGENGGRLLHDRDFSVELAIIEAGVEPHFRAWAQHRGEPVSPDAVSLNVELHRLGDRLDRIVFSPEADYLRGDAEVSEPHSFVVKVKAEYQGAAYQWEFESFEGRTEIPATIAEQMGVRLEKTGPATMTETLAVFGHIISAPGAKRLLHARFDGVIEKMHVQLGDAVVQGQLLATIESNESLQSYSLKAPIAGVVSQQLKNTGEQTAGSALLEITNNNEMWAELAVYPTDYQRVTMGDEVIIRAAGIDNSYSGNIIKRLLGVREDQARRYIATLDNSDQQLSEGMFISAEIQLDRYTVPLAVKRSGLQSYRDFTVVYTKVADTYEVRMLELGRKDKHWVEVISGIEPGAEYVTENSYLIKADIEKAGASHDH
ncbi:MAG: efflux RND transporter periplasmic adaptor subunit [Rickettsiales bacterium]